MKQKIPMPSRLFGLPNAKVVAGRFHVAKQLTEAVNKLRAIAMSRNEKDTLASNFMKSCKRYPETEPLTALSLS